MINPFLIVPFPTLLEEKIDDSRDGKKDHAYDDYLFCEAKKLEEKPNKVYSLVKRHNRFGKSDVRKMACSGLRVKQKIILQTGEQCRCKSATGSQTRGMGTPLYGQYRYV